MYHYVRFLQISSQMMTLDDKLPQAIPNTMGNANNPSFMACLRMSTQPLAVN